MSLGYNPLNIFQFRCARTAASLPAASLANIITGNVAYISNTTAALPVAAALVQFGQSHGAQTTVRSTCSPTIRMIPCRQGHRQQAQFRHAENLRQVARLPCTRALPTLAANQ